MKAKVVLIVCLVAIVGYTAYQRLGKGGPEVDSKNVRASFNAMTLSIVSKNKMAIQNLLSPTFADKKITREELIEILALPRGKYQVNIQAVKASAETATIFYTRIEARGNNGKILKTKIAGETWVRDKKNKALWRLARLAPNDKWFRIKKTPKIKVAGLGNDGKAAVDGQVASLQPGERYSPINKRDPFKSLVIMDFDDEVVRQGKCDQDRKRDLLENYDLPSLKLSGVIGASDGSMALIETPDGKGYTVKQGMHMGKNCGKVTEITSGVVEIKEQIRKVGAKGVSYYETVNSQLKLRPEEG